jgi:hypothetical protein
MTRPAAAVLALALLTAGCGGRAHQNEFVLHIRGDVRAVALQGDRLGWLDWRPTELPTVWTRDLRTGRVRRLASSPAALGDADETKLVLAGRWAGWVIRDLTGNESSDAVGLSAVGRSRTVLSAVYELDPLGVSYGGLGADGDSIFWGTWDSEWARPDGRLCDPVELANDCRHVVRDGAVHRWRGAGADVLEHLPAPLELAAGDGRLAVLPARGGPILVVRDRDGRPVAHINASVAGSARLGVSRSLLAVGDDRGIVFHALPDGRRLFVLRGAHWSFAVAGRRTVAWNASRVVLVDLASRRVRVLARARDSIGGAAIDRRRVAWAVEGAGRERATIYVRQLTGGRM